MKIIKDENNMSTETKAVAIQRRVPHISVKTVPNPDGKTYTKLKVMYVLDYIREYVNDDGKVIGRLIVEKPV